jgi:hypothetical protein
MAAGIASMDFQDSVVFLGAMLVVVLAGGLVGWLLARRGDHGGFLTDYKIELYASIISLLDGLRQAPEEDKHQFVDYYYQVLLMGGDEVVQSINRYLQETGPKDEVRNGVVTAMRKEVTQNLGTRSSLQADEMLSIEVKSSNRDPES